MNMGKDINSGSYDFCPMLSPDVKYLFFTKSANGNGEIYWVDSKIIEEIRQAVSKKETHFPDRVEEEFID